MGALLLRFWPAGVFLGIGVAGIGVASYALASINFDYVLPTLAIARLYPDWWTLGGVVAVLSFIVFTSNYGLERLLIALAAVTGVAALIVLGGILYSLPHHEWTTPEATVGGAFVIAWAILSVRRSRE